ncbi:MAG: hypothetical protein UW68_C0063G0006 [Candidatus Collierbacteria bacterium GW2011_GWB1_44_6]|uniref:Polymorphic outer membrane protein n=1 Tax=Candidatus Collierbacteria bacterium GW2011_GWB1_44_6 TaxID=1618384 RepID=A0A0G1LRQ2_9BACT|nr:MAG: hypothetical protein UW68_C0063G0006 [Candidatus Collierbacteria bacterium GW2011_GWB1_44_6]
MRKEVLFAIIFGIILGGVILFGIDLANKSVNKFPQDQTSQPESPSPTLTSTKTILEIITPQNHSVTTEKSINLHGKATPNSTIALISESEDLILDTSPEGTFSAQINLIAGENTITITNLLKDNKLETISITVIQTNTLPE